jgi:hypothetical protein
MNKLTRDGAKHANGNKDLYKAIGGKPLTGNANVQIKADCGIRRIEV